MCWRLGSFLFNLFCRCNHSKLLQGTQNLQPIFLKPGPHQLPHHISCCPRRMKLLKGSLLKFYAKTHKGDKQGQFQSSIYQTNSLIIVEVTTRIRRNGGTKRNYKTRIGIVNSIGIRNGKCKIKVSENVSGKHMAQPHIQLLGNSRTQVTGILWQIKPL